MPGRPISEDPEAELYNPVETHLAPHHKLILTALEETSQTPHGRVMFLMPPGSAKSTYASVVFPSSYLGRFRKRLILTSYGSDLARKMGRRTRSIIRQKRYQAILNTTLADDSQAANLFALGNGSEYMASGILAGVTGNRADGAICDDLISGREDAQSQTMRDKTWDAYESDLLTRLVPGGWLAFITTRWHQDDPAGRILPDDWNGESGYFDCKDGMRWRVVCLQARCESHTDPLGRQLGEYLWPEWFDAKHWTQFQRNPLVWEPLFQQRPRPPQGTFFTEEMLLVPHPDGRLGPDGSVLLVPVEVPQLVDVVFATIDSAIKTGLQNDGTGVVYYAYSRRTERSYRLAICDWDYEQIKGASLLNWLPTVFTRLERLARETKALYGVAGAFVEDKGSGTILLQQCENSDLPVQAIDSKLTSMGKVERGFDVSPYVAAGDVKVTREAYEKVVTYKEVTKNHLMSQVLGFSLQTLDKAPDDLFDCFCYGVALSLGNQSGF